MNEVEILKVASNHTNVIKLVDIFEDAQHICLVLEYLEGKDLFNFISKNKLTEEHI